jgi:hypothetical protein
MIQIYVNINRILYVSVMATSHLKTGADPSLGTSCVSDLPQTTDNVQCNVALLNRSLAYTVRELPTQNFRGFRKLLQNNSTIVLIRDHELHLSNLYSSLGQRWLSSGL